MASHCVSHIFLCLGTIIVFKLVPHCTFEKKYQFYSCLFASTCSGTDPLWPGSWAAVPTRLSGHECDGYWRVQRMCPATVWQSHGAGLCH